jgi:hypothetical protein
LLNCLEYSAKEHIFSKVLLEKNLIEYSFEFKIICSIKIKTFIIICSSFKEYNSIFKKRSPIESLKSIKLSFSFLFSIFSYNNILK